MPDPTLLGTYQVSNLETPAPQDFVSLVQEQDGHTRLFSSDAQGNYDLHTPATQVDVDGDGWADTPIYNPSLLDRELRRNVNRRNSLIVIPCDADQTQALIDNGDVTLRRQRTRQTAAGPETTAIYQGDINGDGRVDRLVTTNGGLPHYAIRPAP